MTWKQENEMALKMIQDVTNGALDNSNLIKSVKILISQRDNARIIIERYRKRLREEFDCEML